MLSLSIEPSLPTGNRRSDENATAFGGWVCTMVCNVGSHAKHF